MVFRTAVNHFQDGRFWSNILVTAVCLLLEYRNQQEAWTDICDAESSSLHTGTQIASMKKTVHSELAYLHLIRACPLFPAIVQAFSTSLYSSRRLSHSSGVFLRFLLILRRTHVLSFPCFCLQLGRRRGWPHHQRTDWLAPQKPPPISRCEWTLLIHTGKSAEVLHSGILSAGIFGQWGLFHSTPAVSTRR